MTRAAVTKVKGPVPFVPPEAVKDAIASLETIIGQYLLLARLVRPEDEPVTAPSQSKN